MAKKENLLKLEANNYPMEFRASWSLAVFCHSYESILDVVGCPYPLCAMGAGDYGAFSIYRKDNNEGIHGMLMRNMSTVSELHIPSAYENEDARNWILAAMDYCENGGDIPETLDQREDEAAAASGVE